MEPNLVLEQYSIYKKQELEMSPFHFLLNSRIEMNPHQINAFCAAIQTLKTGGIILADEVGLGKTIEAGLVLKYVIGLGAKRVLISLPAALRKQWELELKDKFNLDSVILDRVTVDNDIYNWKRRLNDDNVRIVITSYDYSSKLMKKFPNVKWDFVIIDEAHNLRNVFRGTKRAKKLYELTKGIPKILLTATPLQNTLTDLHGLVSFIDYRIFGSEKAFNKIYVGQKDYSDLKRELSPVLYRTLRKDVAGYMNFKKRKCKTIDFTLSRDEVELYDKVNAFLKREQLYSIPGANSSLIILVIRKLLASSSFALCETFEILKNRLEKLYEGTKSANAQEGFDLFWKYVEDEIDESEFEEEDSEDIVIRKSLIQAELDEVNNIIDIAKKITVNAKVVALKTAIQIALNNQKEHDIPQKVVIFTESKRTQKYIAEELRKMEFKYEDILIFNGDCNDALSKKIYSAWQAKNFGNVNYGRSVEFKHAIVDYFRTNAKILICTDSGSEGLNLQFCSTVINYDLPWNPMKIEQRIGRCHRYGQEHDVVAFNFLNTENYADRRVYEILSEKFELFEGVFGASDIALGALESGVGFEKSVLQIYQECNTNTDFEKDFNRLNRKLNKKLGSQGQGIYSILRSKTNKEKKEEIAKTEMEIKRYFHEVEYWRDFNDPELDRSTHYLRVDNWGEKVFGSHGFLFVGAFWDSNKFLFPVLLFCDENGSYINFSEAELVSELEKIDDIDVKYFTPTSDEKDWFYHMIYSDLIQKMIERYQGQSESIREYNRRKIENWENIQVEQMNIGLGEMEEEISDLESKKRNSNNVYEKADIQKKIDEKKKNLVKFLESLPEKRNRIKNEGDREIAEFERQYDVKKPILSTNIILKF